MMRIAHLFDDTFDWRQRVAIARLLDRLPGDRFAQSVATIAPSTASELRVVTESVRIVQRPGGINALAAPTLRRRLDAGGVDLIHAWGPDAAAASAMASSRPLVLSLVDPTLARRRARVIRTIGRVRGFAVVSDSEWVRRHLIEGGIPPEACATIRPGVDFAFVNRGRARRRSLRERIGVAPDDFVILLSEPMKREDRGLEAFWAAALLNHLSGGVRVIVPGDSAEAHRIARFAATVPSRPTIVTPGREVPFEELLPASDVLVIASDGDVSTTAVAWAMASGAAVIAAAGYAVTELIVNKVNGLLFKRVRGKSAVVSLARLLGDRAGQSKVKEVAHGQAYEVFGLRRWLDQHQRLYENVLQGRSAGEGIVDPARVA